MSDEITIYSQPGALVRRNPRHVLAEAHEAAVALQEIVNARPKKLVLGGETYLEIGDWTTVGHFYGLVPSLVEDRYVEYGGAQGWEATASVRRIVDGLEISRATAMCLNDEENWSSRPAYEWHYVTKTMGVVRDDPGREEIIWEPGQNGKNRPKKVKVKVADEPVPMHQLRSMAQTRANSKALANVLRFVPILAGYKGTPAEEMSGRWGDPDPAEEYAQQAAEGATGTSPTEPKQRRQRQTKQDSPPAQQATAAATGAAAQAADPSRDTPFSVKLQRNREEWQRLLRAGADAGLDEKTIVAHMRLVYSGRNFNQLGDEEAASLLAWAKGPSHSAGTTTRPEPAGVKVNPPATVGEVLARHGIAQEPAVSADTQRKLGILGKWPGTTLDDVRRACIASFGMDLEITLDRIPGAYSALLEWAAESDPQVDRDAVLMQAAEKIGNGQ